MSATGEGVWGERGVWGVFSGTLSIYTLSLFFFLKNKENSPFTPSAGAPNWHAGTYKRGYFENTPSETPSTPLWAIFGQIGMERPEPGSRVRA